MNKEIAELFGLHAGDGTMYRTNSSSVVWELRGGLDEKEFYDTYVFSLLKKIFPGINFSCSFRSGGKNGCYWYMNLQ